MKAGTEEEAVEACCLLACSPWLAQTAFLRHLGPLPTGQHCLWWAGLSHSGHLPRTCPPDAGQAYWSIFSIMISSFQICLGLCQVNKNKPAQQFCGSLNFCFSLSITWILNTLIFTVLNVVPFMTSRPITESLFILYHIKAL